MYTSVQLTVSSSKSRCRHQLNWALASDIPSWLQNEPDDLFAALGRLSCGRRTAVTGSTWHAWWRRRSSGRRSWSDSSSKRWRLPGRSALISGAPSDSSAASSWMRSSLPAASRSRRDVSGLPLLSVCQTGFNVFLSFLCTSLPFAGSLDYLGMATNSHKSSATHSYQCVLCFQVCKQWFGCQCLEFVTGTWILMQYVIAYWGCTNTKSLLWKLTLGEKYIAAPGN